MQIALHKDDYSLVCIMIQQMTAEIGYDLPDLQYLQSSDTASHKSYTGC